MYVCPLNAHADSFLPQNTAFCACPQFLPVLKQQASLMAQNCAKVSKKSFLFQVTKSCCE